MAREGKPIFFQCRFCGSAIKPSAARPFCSGGRCRKGLERVVKVQQVCMITEADRRMSETINDVNLDRGILEVRND